MRIFKRISIIDYISLIFIFIGSTLLLLISPKSFKYILNIQKLKELKKEYDIKKYYNEKMQDKYKNDNRILEIIDWENDYVFYWDNGLCVFNGIERKIDVYEFIKYFKEKAPRSYLKNSVILYLNESSAISEQMLKLIEYIVNNDKKLPRVGCVKYDNDKKVAYFCTDIVSFANVSKKDNLLKIIEDGISGIQ